MKEYFISNKQFNVNGIKFRPPNRPVVVICFDGCANEYLDVSIDKGKMENVKKMSGEGFRGMVRSALPAFTNVNNTSIITGLTPREHGICGNFFYNSDNDKEVMMNSSDYLLSNDTILSAAAESGRKVAVVTAKEKLLSILSYKLNGIAFSAEKARYAKLETHGIDNVEDIVGLSTPEIYSPDSSLFVLEAGKALIENNLSDFLYLSLTDYMQHTYTPYDKESLEFYGNIDKAIGELLSLGAVVGLTADHGMNSKIHLDGSPNVIYLENILEEKFGKGFRVICPITDPYVKHHGALGSYAVIYIDNKNIIGDVKNWLDFIPGITETHLRKSAVTNLEQPETRTGDLVVMSARNYALGRRPEYHDISALDGNLRSHGGRYEEMVPIVISHPLNDKYYKRSLCDPRNFEIFDFTVNGTISE